MKTIIKADTNGYVTIAYDNPLSGERETRTFFCPPNGGYVREDLRNYPQVCEKLSHRGSTLTCSSRDELSQVIRREYRAMRRTEGAEARKANFGY